MCKYCNLNEVEDELHFLMKCKLYTDERNNLLNKVNEIYNVDSLITKELFNFIINSDDKDVLHALGYFITHDKTQQFTLLS